ncbi:hypothetical protein CVT25_003420 [Psilocybe cyanescens]|uniref:Uncharacterized protein n=1 Tax=Psilocybe cyanescens TaxID=93625 RepID=A0A409WM01_PSICY|nr:hypothetical protein CVT25_003420 [Psilocybe cyanescens]
MTTANTNNRASLLAGLRTGGVRSSSGTVPHTAAPAGAFNINVPRFASQQHSTNIFPEEEEDDHVQELPQQSVFNNRNIPMTAAVDGPNNRFSHHQAARGMNPNSMPFSPGFNPNMMPQAQMQMQMLQLEMMRIQACSNTICNSALFLFVPFLQAIQAQQYQAELLAQAQLQQQLQQQQQQQQQQLQTQSRERRTSLNFNPPATAGPLTNSFDLRAATLSAQMRRANQADQLRAQLGVGSAAGDDQVPMTAALGGRFGSRSTSLTATVGSNNQTRFDEYGEPPATPNSTTVISGGTSLGHPASNNGNSNNNAGVVPSKSDSASSWRRGGNNNSVLSGNRAVSSPSVKVTPPPSEERVSPPPGLEGVGIATAASPVSASGPKFRPQPLRFNPVVSQPLPAVAIDNTDEDTDGETQSSGSSVKSSSPTTPRSSSSNEMPLSPREEASKRLFEGLGIGRPVSSTPPSSFEPEQGQGQGELAVTSISSAAVSGHRMVSQPTRQPRGPPSGADELGPKNFATRIRRKAIGGLGMLMGARERREFVEAY